MAKLKLKIFCTDPEAAVKGEYDWAFRAASGEMTWMTDWHQVGETEVELDEVIEILRTEALDKIKKEEAEFNGKVHAAKQEFEKRKQELLALPAPSHLETNHEEIHKNEL